MAPSQKSSGPLPPQSFAQAQRFSNSSNGGRPKQPPRKGPRPARHIPWPEIFRHHISLVEGHLKMIDMVRKHTAEGTGNHRTICDMIDHTKKILYESKTVARIFVPPNDVEQVPLGSSSESMYPGYSIKEHKYGEASERFGNYVAEAKRKGEEIKPQGLEYELGQSKALSSLKLEQMRAKMATQNGGGSASESAPADSTSAEKKVRFSDVSQETAKPEGQMFFMDSKPTPVDLPTTVNKSRKRKDSSSDPEPAPQPVEAQPSKKARMDDVDQASKPDDSKGNAKDMDTTSQVDDKPEQAAENVQVEYEDISAEVDKRMQEKEEKRKRKDQKEKKRKRDSEGSTGGAIEGAATIEVEKPKKKKTKSKITENGDAVENVSSKEDTAMADRGIVEGDNAEPSGPVDKPKKKKKAKASQGSPTPAKNESDSGENGEGATKKKKKEKKAKTPLNTASPAQNDAADADSSPAKRSLLEHSGEQAEGEEPIPKKKKAKVSKDASILVENTAMEKGEKRPAEVAEVEDGEGKRKKQKKRKST